MFPAQQNVVNYQTNSQSKIPDAIMTKDIQSLFVYTTLLKTYMMCFVNKGKQYETNTIRFPTWKIQHKSMFIL